MTTVLRLILHLRNFNRKLNVVVKVASDKSYCCVNELETKKWMTAGLLVSSRTKDKLYKKWLKSQSRHDELKI